MAIQGNTFAQSAPSLCYISGGFRGTQWLHEYRKWRGPCTPPPCVGDTCKHSALDVFMPMSECRRHIHVAQRAEERWHVCGCKALHLSASLSADVLFCRSLICHVRVSVCTKTKHLVRMSLAARVGYPAVCAWHVFALCGTFCGACVPMCVQSARPCPMSACPRHNAPHSQPSDGAARPLATQAV